MLGQLKGSVFISVPVLTLYYVALKEIDPRINQSGVAVVVEGAKALTSQFVALSGALLVLRFSVIHYWSRF